MNWDINRLDVIVAEGIKEAERKEKEKGQPLYTYRCPRCKDVGAIPGTEQGLEVWYQCPRCKGGLIYKDWYKEKHGYV